MTPRALLKPYVVMSRDDMTVCVKIPISSPEDYLETKLTVAEARLHALELMIDADRAERAIDRNQRMQR